MKSKVLLVSLAALVLAACGAANGAAPDGTVLGLTSTNYVTVTQTPTTLLPTTIAGAGNPGVVHPEEGTYVIVAGDFPSTIANKFKVTLDDLIAINGWTLSNGQVPEFNSLAAGATIKIPPNWTEPGRSSGRHGRVDRHADGHDAIRSNHHRGRRPIGMCSGRVHDSRGGHLTSEGRQQARHHGRSARCRQRQHPGLQRFLPRPQDQDAAEGRLLVRLRTCCFV